MKCLYKDNCEKCISVKKRELGPKYLKEKVRTTKSRWTDQSATSATYFVINALKQISITTEKELKTHIIDIIQNPIDAWNFNRKILNK